MVELHPYPWEMRPDREDVFLRAVDRSLISVYFAIYDQYRDFVGKKRWCCKSTFMIEHVGKVLKYHPGARFIYMVRDGRDVAVSAKSSVFNHFHVYYSALRWKREQELGISWLDILPPEQIMLLRYEDLISHPAGVLQRLCGFLGETFEPGMLEYHRFGEAKKSGSLSISWRNTAMPVMSGNSGKFRRFLSEREVLLFEAIAYEALDGLGYTLTMPRQELAGLHRAMMQWRPGYWAGDALLRAVAEARHLILDTNSLMRLRKTFYMKYIRSLRRLSSRYA